MLDPFLSAHGVGPLQFELGGAWVPVSIRDQMVRAQLFVTRALAAGLIVPRTTSARGRALFVVGAGAAGATAALLAAQRGVDTFLLDHGQPFSRQAACTTRWIDPSVYDWPHPTWRNPLYPQRSPGVHLAWRPGFAANVASHWATTLATGSSSLTALYNRRLVALMPHRDSLRVVHESTTPPVAPLAYEDVGALVSAIGFGTERCHVGPAYRGWGFWETDKLGAIAATDQVLISGAGDGALQDFIRVVTGFRGARDVYRILRPHLPATVEEEITHLETEADRNFLWGRDSGYDDHQLLQKLHDAYVRLTQRVLRSAQLSTKLRSIIRHGAARLAFGCSHFGRSYPLNRFIVLLLSHHLDAPFLSRWRVVEITGSGHTCANDPNVCSGQQHALVLQQHDDCRAEPTAVTLPATADTVVVRHGINPPGYVLAGHQAQAPRQMLPFHVLRH